MLAAGARAPGQSLSLREVVSTIEASATTNPREAVTLLDGSLPVDSWLEASELRKQRVLIDLANRVPRPSAIATYGAATVPGIYSDIIVNASWGRLLLGPTEEKARRSALAVLYVDAARTQFTAGFARYRKLKEEYARLLTAWNNTPEAQQTEEMRTRLQFAKDDVDAQAGRYESAIEIVTTFDEREPTVFRDRLRTQLPAAAQSPFPASLTFDRTALVWRRFDSDGAASSTRLPVENPILRWNFCDGSAPTLPTTATQLQVRGEISIQPIERDWLDFDLFVHEGWRLRPGVEPISDQDGTAGSMPVVPTALILARDIWIAGNFPRAELDRLRDARRNGRCARFGPFTVSGPAGIGDGITTAFASRDGVFLPDVHVIGLIVRRIPNSPQPSSANYAWP